MEREHASSSGEHELVGERELFLVPWNYIISGLGRIRHFFKTANQLPKLLMTSKVHLPTNLFFPQARLTGLYGQALPPMPF